MEYLIFILFLLLLLVFVWRVKVHYRNKYRKEIGYTKGYRNGYGYIYWYQGKFELSNFFLIKIGRTNNMSKRMSAASTSNPFGIKLVGCVCVKDDVKAETFLHRKFSKYRINKGNEWFMFTPYMMFYFWCLRDGKLTDRYK